jgi:ribose-phosphate pyrophosphokinase
MLTVAAPTGSLGRPPSGQIQGFFDAPFDHLTALPLLSSYLKDSLGLHGDDVVVVAPDAGRIKTAEVLRKYLHADLAFLYKRRSKTEAHKIEEMAVVGEVDGRPCVARRRQRLDTAGIALAQGRGGRCRRREPVRGQRAARTRSSPARRVSRSSLNRPIH